MLVAVVALASSIIEEYLKPGVGCFMGSISGYFYTPVHSVFISVMVAIGVALIVIKGKTALEDAFLSLAGMMAPIVAFLPTTDDAHGACRTQLLGVHDYLPATAPYTAVPNLKSNVTQLLSQLDPRFSMSSISNNLHALVYAGVAGIGIVFFGWVFALWRNKTNKTRLAEYTTGFRVNLGLGAVVVAASWLLIVFRYQWVLHQHAKAAGAMFVFLAAAALTNWFIGPKKARRDRNYASAYLVIGCLMILAGGLFAVDYEWGDRSWLGGHLVLVIEAVEIALFFVYWLIQTVDRWVETV